MGPPNVPDNDRSNWLTILHRVSDRHVHEVVDLCVCVLHLCVLFCVRVGVWVHICVFVCVCIHLASVINIVAMLSCTLVRIDRMWVVEQSINNNNNENWIKLCVTQWKIQTYLELHLPPRDAQTCEWKECLTRCWMVACIDQPPHALYPSRMYHACTMYNVVYRRLRVLTGGTCKQLGKVEACKASRPSFLPSEHQNNTTLGYHCAKKLNPKKNSSPSKHHESSGLKDSR